jgi:hypothetical protein
VTIERRKHLFPSRTEKLSSASPMVLVPQGSGRVGRCQDLFLKPRFFHKAEVFILNLYDNILTITVGF